MRSVPSPCNRRHPRSRCSWVWRLPPEHSPPPAGQFDDLIAQARSRLATMQAPGTGPRIELTLDDAIARALERNLDLAVQRLNPQVFDLTLAQQLAAYRPTFDTAFSNNSRTNPSSTQLDGGESVVSDIVTLNTGVSQAVGWGGGSYQLNFNNNRAATTNFFSSFNPSYRSNFQASYTQPLLRGFRIDPTRQQIQVTRINRDIADIDLRQTITNTVSAVRDAYWELVYATQTVAVQQQALELAEALVRDNEARVEIGTPGADRCGPGPFGGGGPPADARAGPSRRWRRPSWP